MYKAWDVEFRSDSCDPGCAFDVDLFKRIVPDPIFIIQFIIERTEHDQGILGLVFSSNKIVDNIRVTNAFSYLGIISQIPFLEQVFYSAPRQRQHSALTTGTICPKSPMTFKCLFSSSSRYGTTTFVPALAIGPHG